MKFITRARGGSKERRVLVSKIKVPDLWNVVHSADNNINAHDQKQILEVWHLCHDLFRAVRESNKLNAEINPNLK